MYITASGLAKVKSRLRALIIQHDETRQEAAEMYEEGNSWHDNPMWEDAERRARILAGEIEILRRAISEYTLIAPPLNDDLVTIGHRVDFFDERGRSSYVIILGPLDVDLDDKVISYEAPVAQALLGQSLGTDVSFHNGLMTIENITPWEGFS